jgi:hypothetical protein
VRPRTQRAQRRRVSLAVTFWGRSAKADYRNGRIVNLSESGAYIKTQTPLPPPTIVELRAVLDGEPVQIEGEVVRSIGGTQFSSATDDSGMAVRFCDPESEEARRLTGYGLSPR